MQLEPAIANPRRRLENDLVELPASIRVALKKIVSDMRDMPRDCIHDRAELIHWLNRMARRVEGVERTRVSVERPARAARISPTAKAASEAEKVFGQAPKATPSRAASRRTITSRKGKIIRVETRQLQLFGGQA